MYSKEELSDVDTSTLQYFFPAEQLRYFIIVQSRIRTVKPTVENYLEVVFEEKNKLPEDYSTH